MVGGHSQSLDEELDGFVDAVLVIEAEASHIQRIRICRIHSQNITESEKDYKQKRKMFECHYFLNHNKTEIEESKYISVQTGQVKAELILSPYLATDWASG